MVVSVTLAKILSSDHSPTSHTITAMWIEILAVPFLAITFTQARGPLVGLVISLFCFPILTLTFLGWRTAFRAGILIAASVAITWAVVTLAQTPRNPESPASRSFSIVLEVLGILARDAGNSANAAIASTVQSDVADSIPDAQQPRVATGMEARPLLWRGAGRLVRNRPWFEFAERPLPFSLHIFGYGPEFFQYAFSLVKPRDLTNPQRDTIFHYTQDAHNNMMHRTVELGVFGLAGYLLLLGALLLATANLVMGKTSVFAPNQILVLAALLASLWGRIVEEIVEIPHISDVAFSGRYSPWLLL